MYREPNPWGPINSSSHYVVPPLLQRHAKHDEPDNDAREGRVHGMEAHIRAPTTMFPPRQPPHHKIAERPAGQLAQDGAHQRRDVDEVDVGRGEVVVPPEQDGDDGADADGPRERPGEPEGGEPAGWVAEHDELDGGDVSGKFRYFEIPREGGGGGRTGLKKAVDHFGTSACSKGVSLMESLRACCFSRMLPSKYSVSGTKKILSGV